MTFDELFRADLALERAFIDSTENAEEIKLVDNARSSDLVPDHPDEAEVNRFLEWLEESLLSRNAHDLA